MSKLQKQVITGTGDNFGFEDEKSTNAFLYESISDNALNPQINTVVVGTLVSRNSKFSTFATNMKSDVLVYNTQSELANIASMQIGDTTEILIKEIVDNRKETIMYGSVMEVESFNYNTKVISALEKFAANKEVISGTPIGYTIFGYDVAVNIEYGETIIHLPHLLADINKLPSQEMLIGQEIQFHILKDEKGRFIASRKSYLLTLAKKELKSLKIGQVYTGSVTGTSSYAVFVQIGNLSGMVHESNLGEEGKALLKEGKIVPGMEIDVYLKDIQGSKLNLTQIWRDSLWDTIKNGDKLEGTITSVKHFNNNKDFGVLVQLDFETKGMIHSSNLEGAFEDYKVGQKLNVQVQNVYKQKRQITLTLNK